MKPALLGFFLCATLAGQPASLEGKVVNQATGLPLAGVHVRLVTGDFTDSGADQIVYGAISDRAGHFSVTNMKPGIYVVIPDRAVVRVRLVTGDFTDSGADQIVYGAISDRAGHFSVT